MYVCVCVCKRERERESKGDGSFLCQHGICSRAVQIHMLCMCNSPFHIRQQGISQRDN